MSETIKIINHMDNSFPITEGIRTQDLISRLIKLNDEERNNLRSETRAILSECIKPNDSKGSTSGIAIGYVQSGKTMSFTTLTALAIDNGFRIIVYFAGIKNNLLEQTTRRLKQDLLTESDNSTNFKVYQNPTTADNFHSKLSRNLKLSTKPAILITVLKHYQHIDELTKIFNKSEVRDCLQNCGVLIIDDEADQASLNTYARKNSKAEDWEEDDFSSTYSSILNLKSSLKNHSYVQYTATPQGPLLINLMDLLSPKFHVVLTPGKAYTGGKTFFIDNTDLSITIPDAEVYHHKKNQLVECPQSLINALQLFLMGVAITVNIQKKEHFLSMMIHADSKNDASRKFNEWVKNLIDNWSERLKLPNGDPSKIELIKEFRDNFQEAIRRVKDAPSFQEVITQVLEVLLDTNIALVIQDSKEKIDWSNASSHILIGAEMLNRGFTVEGLAVSYMPRHSVGKSNADTIQQRCRFFGYKQNYLDSCRVFLPNDSIIEYREYIEHEEIMRNSLKEKSLGGVQEQLIILNSGMNATRNNILTINVVKHKLNGWRQINALQQIDENIDFVNEFIKNQTFTNYTDFETPDRKHRFVKLEIREVIEFLKDFKIANVPDTFRKSSTIQYLSYLAETKGLQYAYIFEMSYAVEKGRERALDIGDGNLKISNIFSGRSTAGSDVYPGDKEIKFEDFFCIQIHRIKLKHHSILWDTKMVYTLGIYYPESIAHSFIGIKK